jgi:DNA-binding GntR family transcriptional regulator
VPATRASRQPPAYAVVAQSLRQDIQNGRFAPGDRLPSEHELMATHQVSRTTVRKALEQLVAANLVQRHQGRGTFVAPQGLSHGLGDLRSLTEVMHDRGLEPGIRNVRVGPDRRAPSEAYEHLRTHEVWCISRTRTGDGVPFCTQDSWVPKHLGTAIDADELTARQSLYALLREDLDAVPDEATEIIRAESASDEEAGRLEVPPGSALIVIYRWTQDHRGLPIEYARSASPGDRYEYVIRLQG